MVDVSKWSFPKLAHSPGPGWSWPPRPCLRGESKAQECLERHRQGRACPPGAQESPFPSWALIGRMPCAQGPGTLQTKGQAGPAAGPGCGPLAPSWCICAVRLSFSTSELQLVKFYSGRKLVTSLSNYMGLESAHPVQVQPGGICRGEELQPLFQAFRASDAEACRGAGSSECEPVRIMASRQAPHSSSHTAFARGSGSYFCQTARVRAGTCLPLELGA